MVTEVPLADPPIPASGGDGGDDSLAQDDVTARRLGRRPPARRPTSERKPSGTVKRLDFGALWEGYPSDPPYVDPKTGEPPKGFEDQCAIKVSVALHKAGESLEAFDGKGVVRLDGQKTAIRAEELAKWLQKGLVPGVGKSEDVTGKDWASKIEDRTGIVYFADYWERAPGVRTGDHIDLWNGSRMTKWTSWMRVHLGASWDGWWSDYSQSKKILFFPVAKATPK